MSATPTLLPPPRSYLRSADLLDIAQKGASFIGNHTLQRLVGEIFRLRAKCRYQRRRILDLEGKPFEDELSRSRPTETLPADETAGRDGGRERLNAQRFAARWVERNPLVGLIDINVLAGWLRDAIDEFERGGAFSRPADSLPADEMADREGEHVPNLGTKEGWTGL